MRYKARSIEEIEVIQWNGKDLLELSNFVGEKLVVHNGAICINTPKGILEISAEDYIIKDSKGEFSFCKPDVFKKNYETRTEYGTVQAVDSTTLVIDGIINEVLEVLKDKQSYIYQYRYDYKQYDDLMELMTQVELIGKRYKRRIK